MDRRPQGRRERRDEQGGTVPILVAYNIPDRDCGNHSSGGAANVADYKKWIDGFAAGIGDHKVVVILEPDALWMAADADRCKSDTRKDHLNALT